MNNISKITSFYQYSKVNKNITRIPNTKEVICKPLSEYYLQVNYVNKNDRLSENVKIYQFLASYQQEIPFYLSISNIMLNHENIKKVLRYQDGSTILYFNFYEYFNVQVLNDIIGNVSVKSCDRIIKIDDNYFHEIFLDNTPTRFFLDLDFDKTLELSQVDKVIDEILDVLENKIIYKSLKYSRSYNVDIISAEKVDNKCHIIFENVVLPNIGSAKILARDLQHNLGQELYKYIDCQPYHVNGSLRMVGGIKENKRKILTDNNNVMLIQDAYAEVNYNEYNSIDISYEPCYNEDNINAHCYIDLTKYKCKIIAQSIPGCFTLEQEVGEECPLCHRVHDKRDSLYLVKVKSNIYLKCHRCNNDPDLVKKSIMMGSSKVKMIQQFENIKPVSYNDLNPKYFTKYSNRDAQLPEYIDGDVLYLNSPCMSSKTKLIYEFLEQYAEGNSILFITTQRLFTQNLSDRFQALDFVSYLSDDFEGDEERVICSLYSLHRIQRQYDYVILDEYETIILSGVSNISKLGQQVHHKINFETFISLIKEAHMCICMDAYASKYGIDFMNILGKEVHLHFNEYKTHSQDTIVFMENDEFIIQMAESLYANKNIVFASGYKKKANIMINKVMGLLQKRYDVDISEIKLMQYNSDMDKVVMSESIKNINEEWSNVQLLTYTPSITAGISYELEHYDQVFYYMNAANGHIPGLQALYRVRNVSEKKYFITFNPYQYKEINIETVKNRFEYLLNYDVKITNNKEYKKLSKTYKNEILYNSMKYYNYSTKMFYQLFVGQLKYNESKIKYGRDDDDDEDKQFLNENKKNMNKYLKYYDEVTRHIQTIYNPVPEDFNPLSDDDFKKLKNKVNRSLREHEVFLINLYKRIFPKFINRYYYDIKKDHGRFKHYYEYQTGLTEFSKLKLDNKIRKIEQQNTQDITILMGDKLRMRFKLLVATMLLKHIYCARNPNLKSYKFCDDELGGYRLFHMYFEDKIITLTEVRNAFKFMCEHHTNNGDTKFIKMFENCYYSSGQDKNKNYLWAREWKSYKPLMAKIFGPTYNFDFEIIKERKKESVIKFCRYMTLF